MAQAAADRLVPGEQPLRPAQVIIDAHHHLWELREDRGERWGPLWHGHWFCAAYGPDDLLADAGAMQLAASVYMECHSWYRGDGPEHLRVVGETEHANSVASAAAGKGPALCAAIISHANFALPPQQLQEQIEAHRAAAPERFRGVRYSAAYAEGEGRISLTPRDGMLNEPAVLENLRWYATQGLVFECFLYAGQGPQLARAARECPEMTVVCNHALFPVDVRGAEAERVAGEWRAAVAELAQCPNVVMKIGGLTMPACGFGFNEGAKQPSSEKMCEVLLPWYRHCIELFGPSRCMFESNFPVDKMSCGYINLWNTLLRVAAAMELSDADTDLLCRGTAARIYGITLSAP
eukprot:TRINITY_DN19538_c0_g1_i1.p2 TRINITY_DN19538_c0_g1~~TRINITY_DN19538_c0_g1_i1.p2  ORF type:complete len:350 (+),score=114.89 TRINITY_DN19538_c0_g1_i1:69-1118(+)